MSDEIVALIDRLIEEHRVIGQNMESLENITKNDAGAILSFEKAKELYMPGRTNSRKDLEKLDELLKVIDEGLEAHFRREETGLKHAFDTLGTQEMSDGYETLMKEHNQIRERLVEHANIRNSLFEGLQASGEGPASMTRQQWEGKANDMRAYIIFSRKMIQDHTYRESQLFRSLKETLLAGAKE